MLQDAILPVSRLIIVDQEDKADRGRGGKTISGNGQAWSSPGHRGQWRTGKDGKKTG